METELEEYQGNKMTHHKWHKEIKAWADGAEIEVFDSKFNDWVTTDSPSWNTDSNINLQYRIKPQPKEKKSLYVVIFNGNPEKIRLTTKLEFGFMEYVMGKIEVQDD
jgi:hypothetical protein